MCLNIIEWFLRCMCCRLERQSVLIPKYSVSVNKPVNDNALRQYEIDALIVKELNDWQVSMYAQNVYLQKIPEAFIESKRNELIRKYNNINTTHTTDTQSLETV